MRILILSQHYTPEPLPKAHELAEGLRDRGHEVTVITGFPNYPSGEVYQGYRVKLWSIRVTNGIRLIRLALYPYHNKSSVLRSLNYLSFAATAAIFGTLLCGKIDAMYVIHPPLTIGIAAWILSRLRRVPYVYGVADLWPEAVVASGMVKRRQIIALLERLERFVYSRANAVAVVSPGMIDHLQREGVKREKLHVITDWADERVYEPNPGDPVLAERLSMAGKFNVVFGGQIGIAQKLETLVQAASILRSYDGIQFVIAGDGVERARLEKELARTELTNVRFVGRFSPADMARIYALADVLLVHLSAQPIFRLSIPAKTYAYMACGKPVLMAADGAAAELVRANGVGLACPPENPVALAETVMRFFTMSHSDRKDLGRRARELFLEHYSRSVVLRKCEVLLASVAGEKVP